MLPDTVGKIHLEITFRVEDLSNFPVNFAESKIQYLATSFRWTTMEMDI